MISRFGNCQRDIAGLTCSMLCEGCAAMPPDSRPSTSAITQHGPSNLALPGIIGRSQGLHEVVRTTHQVAPSRACVLIVGETGTGKELIARAIHDLSPRCTGPYIRVNCGALTESLLESELFGHVKGSFTGAVDNRTGRFEACTRGASSSMKSTAPRQSCRSSS